METSTTHRITRAALARRLGLTTKQTANMLKVGGVEPSEFDGNESYDLEEVVNFLGKLSVEDEILFRAKQQGTVFPKSFYAGKFKSLKPFCPPEVERKRRHGRVSVEAERVSADSPKVDSADLKKETGFVDPRTVGEVASILNIPKRIAGEALYGSGLPLFQYRQMTIVDLDGVTADSFIVGLPDGLREKVLVAQANTKSSPLDYEKLAKALKIDVESVEPFLSSLPGEPSFLTGEAVEVVKAFYNFEPLRGRAIQFSEQRKADFEKRKKQSKNRFVSAGELAEMYEITASDVKTLINSGVFPTNKEGRVVRRTAVIVPRTVIDEVIDENRYTLQKISDELSVPTKALRVLLKEVGVTPVTEFIGDQGNVVSLYSDESVNIFRRSDAYVGFADVRDRSAKKQQKAYEKEVRARVGVNVRERFHAPEQSIFYIGPTNSGKTYHSLNALFEEYEANDGEGRYVYAGPLRMLAFEVYEKMVERYGEANVGFLTGEEQINPEAAMVACTVEMAPTEGTSLVLDEAHWVVEPHRGQNWTNLLLGGRYENLHILTAKEAVETIEKLVADSAYMEKKEFTRKTPIVYAGELNVKEIPKRTAVVAFSRKTVYALAASLSKAGKKVGVLYGALPLKVRKAQIEKYVNGDFDIMVTTDVIGHGINLPIDNVVFAQSEKFDGVERRELHTWEVAQIAGRAGRYGLSSQGQVYVLKGRDWFTRNYALIMEGTLAAGGIVPTDLNVTEAIVHPFYRDLAPENASDIRVGLDEWVRQSETVLADRPVVASTLQSVNDLLTVVEAVAGIPPKPSEDWSGLDVKEAWQLVTGPFSSKNNVLNRTVRWLQESDRDLSDSLERYFLSVVRPVDEFMKKGGRLPKDQVDSFEQIVREIGELKMVLVMFKTAGTLRLSQLMEYEDIINETLIRVLGSVVESNKYGVCSECKGTCAPWFDMCQSCQFESQWW